MNTRLFLAAGLLGLGITTYAVWSRAMRTPPTFDSFITSDLNDAGSPSDTLPHEVQARALASDLALDSVSLGEPALVRMIYGRTACATTKGNPRVVLPAAKRPLAGQPFSITFATHTLAGSTWPGELAVLVQSHRPATPIDFTAYGAPGCWLLVNLDASVYIPTTNGIGTWTWTPPAWASGVHLFMQLIVFSPEANRAGAVGSPGIELIVGQW